MLALGISSMVLLSANSMGFLFLFLSFFLLFSSSPPPPFLCKSRTTFWERAPLLGALGCAFLGPRAFAEHAPGFWPSSTGAQLFAGSSSGFLQGAQQKLQMCQEPAGKHCWSFTSSVIKAS